MQKIARRVATAERVAAKRQKIRDLRVYRRDKQELFQQRLGQLHAAKREIESAKQAIKDDWAMGSLSPRIDVGEFHGARGAVSEARFGNNDLSFSARDAHCRWAGGVKYLSLAVGDRVVVLEGPDKGRIGKVVDINDMTAEVTVKDLNKTNIRLNELMRTTGDEPLAANMELPLSISAVRLVHPITDPSTGKTNDVIINQLVPTNLVTDRQTGKRRWDRVVPGLNLSIPWPVKEEPETADYPCDTLRIDVEERTFVPTLLRPPMPETVIDELRNRYSRFRTRHEPEYIARIEAEEQAKKDRQKLMESMRTPLQEFHRAERENKKKKGKPRLTLEMLEKIGEVIARNRERALNAAGVTDVSTPPSSTETSTTSNVPPPPPPTSATTESSPPPPST